MKKLLFGLMATVLFGFVGNAKHINNEIEINASHINPERITLVLHLEFGRVSRDCRGFGFCGITGDIEITRGPFMGGADSNGNLEVDITTEGLKTIKSYFGSDKIVVEESYTLNEKACQNLGLKSGYTVRAGTYKIVLKDKASGTYRVTL